jgi:asparagine synthase (glutamine-hydrolysing)
MCGLAGLLATAADADVSRPLTRLGAGLVHRGPDGSGSLLVRGRSIGITHRRLSIVDIAGGAQPMCLEDGRLYLVYNGEVYNWRELRSELEARGHRFVTRSDTEVVLRGWAQWGAALCPRLNGIYAFAVLDGRNRERGWHVTLVRDPVGAKPLYLGRFPSGWWFASELAAARNAGLVDQPLDHEALAQFLVYRFVPSPRTAYRNTWKVPPGHCVSLAEQQAGEPEFRSFIRGFDPASVPETAGEWEEALSGGISAAIARQMMSDVPVGSLLSGGVDSTVVTQCMTHAAGMAPDCFAIGFASEPDGGELANARRVAAVLRAPLHETQVHDEEYLDAWPGLLGSFGEPVANSGVLLVGLLCGAVARTHKVVLSGQGADEPLGGYPRHAGERWAAGLRRMRRVVAHMPEGWAESDRVRRLVRVAGAESEAVRFTELLAVFGIAEARALSRAPVSGELLVQPVRAAIAASPATDDRLNRLLTVDAHLSLADDLLLVADHMSMAHSVELRVPFLDLELLGLVNRMPSRYKVSLFGERKWLYRRAVTSLIPSPLRRSLLGVRARTGRKLGFATPLERWFGGWVHEGAERALLGKGALIADVLQPGPVRALLQEAQRGRPHARQLLALFALEGWLQGQSASEAAHVA